MATIKILVMKMLFFIKNSGNLGYFYVMRDGSERVSVSSRIIVWLKLSLRFVQRFA